MTLINNNIEKYNLIQLNELIHIIDTKLNYHMLHTKLTCKYAIQLAKMISPDINIYKLRYSALSHDLLKIRNCDMKGREIVKNNITIPLDLNWYVRSNLDILIPYKLDDYFNTDMQLHALASGIYLIKELNITDPEILYPIFFHSCPIISVYETLDPHIQLLVDIIGLADKLSSNNIKVSNSKVSYNFENVVFGKSKNEFNFSLGLLIARAIAQGNNSGEHAKLAIDYYLKRLIENQPFISNKIMEDIKSWLKSK